MLSSCREIPTSVKVGNGPSFSFHGSGRLASFRIYGPQPGYKIATPFDAKSLVWRVQPTEGYFKGARVEGSKIEYGSIPVGTRRRYQTVEPPLRCLRGKSIISLRKRRMRPQPRVSST